MATGYGDFGPFAERWDGNSWTIVPVDPVQPGTFYGVSCATTTFCVAVGEAGSGPSIIEQWNGTAFARVTSPDPGDTINVLNAVSCASPAFCMAVGTSLSRHTGSGYETYLAEVWNGSSWSTVSVPQQYYSFYDDVLHGVQCLAVNACVAIGDDTLEYPNRENAPDALFWDGVSWTSVPPGGADADGSGTAISCTSLQSCVAVGSVYLGFNQTQSVPDAMVWNGSTWTITKLASSATSLQTLSGVSCASPTYCVGVGTVPGTQNQMLVEQYDGTTWTAGNVVNPSNSNNTLLGVSCPAVRACVIAGDATDLHAVTTPLVLSDYLPGIQTSVLTLADLPEPITAPATQLGYAAVSYPTPEVYRDGQPDPDATATCSPSSGALFPVGQTTTVICAGSDPALPFSTMASFTVTATQAAPTGLQLSPANGSMSARAPQTFTARTVDAYGNAGADVTNATTFTASGTGSCTLNTCTAPAPTLLTITGVDGALTGRTTLTVTKQVIPIFALGEEVGGARVYFAGAYTDPDGALLPATGIDCTRLLDGTLIVPTLPFDHYDIDPASCTVDQPVSGQYVLKVTGGSFNAQKFALTTPTLPAAHLGASYTQRIGTSGGTGPVQVFPYSAPPPGIYSNAPNGILSGKPTQVGTFEFTVLIDDKLQEWSWPFSITVAPSATLPNSITSAWLEPGTLGKSYNATLTGAGGKGAHHWSVTSGALPAGLKLSGGGTISGTLATAQATTFTVTMSDSAAPASSVTRQFTIPVYPITTTPVGPSLKDGKVKAFYSQAFHASGGVAPLTWTATGSLPPGLTLTGGGTLRGTPTTAGAYYFTVVMTDAHGNTASTDYNLTVK